MSTILMDAKSFYNEFFEGDAWSDKKASKFLGNRSNLKNRKIVLKFCYKVILNNRKTNDALKQWVRTDLSLEKIAMINNITISRMRNIQTYAARTLDKELSHNDKNLINVMVYSEEISNDDWKEIAANIELVKLKRGKEVGDTKPLVQNKDILINIPANKYVKSLDNEAEWNHFLQLITPYFINERRKAQQLVNTTYSEQAAYLNYLITPGIKMNDIDKRRYKEIKGLLGEENEIIKSISKSARESKIVIENKTTSSQNKEVEQSNSSAEHMEIGGLYDRLASMTGDEWKEYTSEVKEKYRNGTLTNEEWKAYLAETKQRLN